MYKDIDVEALCAHRPDIPAKGTEMGNYFRNNIRNYYACITGVDEQVGRIIETLKSNGLFENTIVVFTSDHGSAWELTTMPERISSTKNHAHPHDYFMAGKDKATQR